MDDPSFHSFFHYTRARFIMQARPDANARKALLAFALSVRIDFLF